MLSSSLTCKLNVSKKVMIKNKGHHNTSCIIRKNWKIYLVDIHLYHLHSSNFVLFKQKYFIS